MDIGWVKSKDTGIYELGIAYLPKDETELYEIDICLWFGFIRIIW